MSCSCCNSSPCLCVPKCATECPEIIDYSFENVNLGGIGVLDGVVGQAVQFRGVRSTNSNIVVTNNAALNTVDIELSNDTFKATQTFANAAARAAAVPQFQGQLGFQIDTVHWYYSTGVAAGNWATNLFHLGQTNTLADNNTFIDLNNGKVLTITDSLAGSGGVTFSNSAAATFGAGTVCTFELGSSLDIDAGSQMNLAGDVFVASGGSIELSAGGILNFNAGSKVRLGGVNIAALSAVITGAVAGELSSKLINTFLSTSNTQVGWGTPSGTLARTTYASYAGQVISNPPTDLEVQDIDDALVIVSQRLAALITDLKAVLLPAT